MQFSAIFAAAALAITTVSAAPAVLETRAPEGLLDFYDKTGCKPEDKCVIDFRLQRGCQPIPAGCRYGTKLTTLGLRCTVKLHIDGACQDTNNVITLMPAELDQCRQPSDVFGIQSVFTSCDDSIILP
ncbi:hypothetical protein BJ875DRAFT_132986 [Amylocarpus encephaloides]|uniref:Uncharacterized protein n=1 Tax=Amylocarpus encephaloides TaxID=45428 RepID=A0A9P8C2K9_9HELO|nr:hypothetical protein BJ875DRAFT_132986 [Amylocarpus encephaloides]